MAFEINIVHDRKRYKLRVEQVLFSSVKEQFKIKGKTSEIVLESNRPLFRNKGINQRFPQWKIVKGELLNTSLVEIIVNAIMAYLEPLNKKPL